MTHRWLREHARITAALGTTALLCAPAYALRPPPPTDAPAVPAEVTDADELVVLASSDGDVQRLRSSVVERGYAVRASYPLAGLDLVMITLTIPANVTPLEAIAEVEAILPGSTAGVNHRYELQGLDKGADGDTNKGASAAAPRRYAERMIDWLERGCTARVVIGLLDGAIDASDDALDGIEIETKSFVDADTDPRHATAVASLIAGKGRLRDAALRAATVADATGEAGVDAIVRGLDWTVSRGARVVNVALSGPYNKILDRGFEAATGDGVAIVAAVGNEGPEVAPRYPAAFGDVLAVTALDANAAILPDAVRGDHVSLAAPGVEVWSPAGGGCYETGTSFATAFATAMLAAAPDVDAAVASILTAAEDLGAPGPDPVFGRGLAKMSPDCFGR